MTAPFIANLGKLFLGGINFYCQSVVEIIVIDSNFSLPRFFLIRSSCTCPSFLSTWFSSAQSSFILKVLVHFCKKILKAHAILKDPKCRRPRTFWKKIQVFIGEKFFISISYFLFLLFISQKIIFTTTVFQQNKHVCSSFEI